MTRERSDSDPLYRIRSGENGLRRRKLLAVGGAAGAALFAGCTGDGVGATGDADPDDNDGGDAGGGDTDGADDADDADGSGGDTGTFRLLVTDLPADIGDFDSLEVTLDRARVFRSDSGGGGGDSGDGGDGGGEGDGGDGDDSDAAEDDAAAAETDDDRAAGNETGESEDGEEDGGDGGDGGEEGGNETDGGETDDGEGQRDFFWLDLDGATVDLTQVIGDKAVSVFEGELDAGTYSKVELHAAEIEGIVDGERVDVKIPSGKLQIVHEFEVSPDDPVDFVFDIHVVRKGNGGYNLRPVISGSGVNGTDVEVEEIDPDEDGDGSGENDDGGDDGGSGGADGESGDADGAAADGDE